MRSFSTAASFLAMMLLLCGVSQSKNPIFNCGLVECRDITMSIPKATGNSGLGFLFLYPSCDVCELGSNCFPAAQSGKCTEVTDKKNILFKATITLACKGCAGVECEGDSFKDKGIAVMTNVTVKQCKGGVE